MAPSCPKLHLLLFLLLLVLPLLTRAAAEDWTAVASQPQQQQQLQSVLVDTTRRRLNSFRICALCTCCGGPKGLCLPSPCCYAINCNIPNRPFGFCSFTPKTCNCFGCHL